MGGTPSFIPRVPQEVAEATYGSVVDKLGLAELSVPERIERLKITDRVDWVTKLSPGLALSPVTDENEKKPPFYQVYGLEGETSPPGSDWCPRIMLGDCEMDVSANSAGYPHNDLSSC